MQKPATFERKRKNTQNVSQAIFALSPSVFIIIVSMVLQKSKGTFRVLLWVEPSSHVENLNW